MLALITVSPATSLYSLTLSPRHPPRGALAGDFRRPIAVEHTPVAPVLCFLTEYSLTLSPINHHRGALGQLHSGGQFPATHHSPTSCRCPLFPPVLDRCPYGQGELSEIFRDDDLLDLLWRKLQ